eukprot:322561-Chlamydomonas_euryale.AAC.5
MLPNATTARMHAPYRASLFAGVQVHTSIRCKPGPPSAEAGTTGQAIATVSLPGSSVPSRACACVPVQRGGRVPPFLRRQVRAVAVGSGRSQVAARVLAGPELRQAALAAHGQGGRHPQGAPQARNEGGGE